MKVVLFCGGRGLRLREFSGTVPKPMVSIGGEPALLHVMRYYAHFGHSDFILCLGYKGDVIRSHFTRLGAVRAEQVPSSQTDGAVVERAFLGSWNLTFLQTGVDDTIGDRLRRAKPLLGNDEIFLANYSDDLADAPLDRMIDAFTARPGMVASFISVKPNLSLHVVDANDDGTVVDVALLKEQGVRVNGGYFIFRRAIFDALRPGEELVDEPFHRLIERRSLVAYRHDGFWGPLDTLKDHQYLEDLAASGSPPWQLWPSPREHPGPTPSGAVGNGGPPRMSFAAEESPVVDG